MDRSVRFGIVGWGVIGPTHAAAIAATPGAELAAVADPAPASPLPAGVRGYPDLPSLLRAESLDAVAICTPSGLHASLACEAMQAGLHVVVEKPLDIRTSALDAVQSVQATTGRQVGVIFQHRFDAASRALKAAIERGSLGRLVLGTVQVPWWRTQEYYESGAWRGTEALDGGVLMNQAIHSLDLLLWFLGPVQSVVAYTGTLAHRMEVEDTAAALLRFASGALGTVAASTAALPGNETRIEVFGDGGSAALVDDRLAYLRTPGETVQEGAVEGTGVSHAPALGWSASHAAQYADFVAAVREGRAPTVDAAEGRRAVDLILAMYESARTGREVALSCG